MISTRARIVAGSLLMAFLAVLYVCSDLRKSGMAARATGAPPHHTGHRADIAEPRRSGVPTTRHDVPSTAPGPDPSAGQPAIAGIVVRGNGEPAVGARVVAMRQNASASEDEIQLGADISDRLRFTCAGPDGRFSLSGLHLSAPYILMAAADGELAREPLWNIAVGSGDQRIVLDALYRSRIILTDGRDGRLAVDNCISYTVGVATKVARVYNMTDTTSRRLERAIMGPVDLEPEGLDRILERWFLSPGRMEATEIGTVTARVPGYQRVEAPLMAYRAIGAVPDQRIELLRDAGGLGRLSVMVDEPTWLQDESAQTLGKPQRYNLGQLVMTDSVGSGLEIVVTTDALLSKGQTVTLPAGRYDAYFLASTGTFRFPDGNAPIPIEVMELGDPVSLRIPLARSGKLDVHLRDREGVSFNGAVVLRVSYASARGFRHFNFDSAPYELRGLELGLHRVSAMLPFEFEAPGAERWRGSAEIALGARCSLELVETVVD